MNVGETIIFTRDFPRLQVKAGETARIDSVKGEGIFEVSFYSLQQRDRQSLIVIKDWIKEEQKQDGQ